MSVYPLEVGIVVTWFVIRRTLFTMGAGGMAELSVEFDIEGEWTRLEETWSEDKFLDTIFDTGLLVQY